MFQKGFLRRNSLGFAWGQAFIAAVAVERPRFTIVGEEEFEVPTELFSHRFLADFEAGFIAAEHVSVHPIRTAAVIFLVTIVEKVVDARVLEEATDD